MCPCGVLRAAQICDGVGDLADAVEETGGEVHMRGDVSHERLALIVGTTISRISREASISRSRRGYHASRAETRGHALPDLGWRRHSHAQQPAAYLSKLGAEINEIP